jgi:hypothetical protein
MEEACTNALDEGMDVDADDNRQMALIEVMTRNDDRLERDRCQSRIPQNSLVLNCSVFEDTCGTLRGGNRSPRS